MFIFLFFLPVSALLFFRFSTFFFAFLRFFSYFSVGCPSGVRPFLGRTFFQGEEVRGNKGSESRVNAAKFWEGK